MPLERGRLLSHYRIVEKLGEEGMGAGWTVSIPLVTAVGDIGGIKREPTGVPASH